MKRYLALLLFLLSVISYAQNRELIKEVFFKQKIGKIENIALKNGYNGGDIVSMNVSFKSDKNGDIFDIDVNEKAKIFESELLSIVKQIPKLNPKEYLSKGNEMKYGLKIHIRLPKNRKRIKRIKKGKTELIKYIAFYVKEYFPVKWIKTEEVENIPFSIIKRIPITKNCKNSSDEIEMRTCVSKDIQKHVAKKFDVDLMQNLGLPSGKQRVVVTFIISKTGEVVNIKATGGNKLLEEEAIRVINSLPNFYKAGTIDGKPANVEYRMPISFVVQ